MVEVCFIIWCVFQPFLTISHQDRKGFILRDGAPEEQGEQVSNSCADKTDSIVECALLFYEKVKRMMVRLESTTLRKCRRNAYTIPRSLR